MRFRLFIVWFVLTTIGFDCAAGPKRAAARNAAVDIGENIQTDFQNWDSNDDGQLDLKELNAAIENPDVTGVNAAIAVAFRRKLNADIKADEDVGTLTATQISTLKDDAPFQRQVKTIDAHINKVSRALFLPNDPNLYTFHQGPVGDCYLMSVLGAMVYRDPGAIHSMIEPLPDGGFSVHFASGRTVTIPKLTAGELVIGSPEGSNHGIWMGVFEQTWAQLTREVRAKKSGTEIEDDEALDTDLIGHGGYVGPIIGRFTGYKASYATIWKWFKQDPNTVTNRMEKLLINLTADHRIIVASTAANKNKKLPVPYDHFFAVLSYDTNRHLVKVFNPWGNFHKPVGPPGLQNGYATEHGFFEVPIGDFVQIFSDVAYETRIPFKG